METGDQKTKDTQPSRLKNDNTNMNTQKRKRF